MRKYLFILFLLFTSALNATKYYVAPSGGSNGNAGTNIAAPWATWQYAFTNTPAGDTCYFLNGVWYPTSTISFNAHSGTHSSPTCFFAYPGATPILDMQYTPGGYGISTGYSTSPSYIYMKGLTIRHFPGSYIIFMYRSSGYLKFENCVVHHGAGQGFYTEDCDTVYYYNCDAHDFCDTLSTEDPGGWGVGFGVKASHKADASMWDSYVYFKGCRAWRCSDQGWSVPGDGLVVLDSCWSLYNGFHWGDWEILSSYGDYGYNGNGIKWDHGWEIPTDKGVTRIIQNCIFAFNEYMGMAENNWISDGHHRSRIQNNFVYNNGHDHYNGIQSNVKYNFDFWNEVNTNNYDRIFSNNLSYKAGYSPEYSANGDRGRAAMESGGEFISQTNYWNSNTSVTDADFITLDSIGMCGARQADWTLPYTQFGHLAPGSNLIDAGTDVGLAYTGAAPDIGWVEATGEVDATATYILTFTFPQQTGAAVIDTTAKTVTIEVQYGSELTNLAPTITMSYGATISPLSGLYCDFTNPFVYTVTAQDAVTTQEWTVTVTVDEAPIVLPTVTTAAVSNILTVTATGNGNITDDGNGAITQYGVCWNTVTNPTTANSHTSEVAGVEGAFTSAMTGMTFNTHYYVRAYATNSAGTSYGSNVEFTTLDATGPPITTMGTMLKVKGANKFVSKKTTNTLLKKKN